MNNIEIIKKRKELGFTQEELAKKLGVSLKTISNYEKGNVIPYSKKALLHEILNPEIGNNTVNEGTTPYILTAKTYLEIEKINEKITERERIIVFSNDKSTIDHEKEMIKLLNFQIKVLNNALEEVNFDNKLIAENKI